MRAAPLLLLAALALGACGSDREAPEASGAAVARVGEAVLTEADLQAALGDATQGLDSVAARGQVIEQWVRRELLVQAARREGLPDEPDVQRLLRDSEASALEAAYLDRFFESAEAAPTAAEITSYFEANRERLTLREPYVRVRLLRTAPRRAEEAASALGQIQGSPLADSLFALAAREFTADPKGAIALADTYLPESRLTALNEALGQRIAQTGAGAAPFALAAPEAGYAVSVVERVQAGQAPSLGMVRPEIVERLAIRKRNAAAAQHIRRLRAEAEAAGRLDAP